MGVAESKILAQNVLTACQNAEKDGKSKLDGESLWSNEDTLKAVKNVYRYIPQNIRGTSRQSTIKKAIARSKSRLDVPQVIQELRDKSEELFPGGQSDYDGSSTPLPPQTNPLACYYKLVVHYEKQLDLDKIRLRLLYVAFYRVKQNLQPGSQYEYYDATPIAQAIFESGSVNDTLDTICAKVRTWIGFGERYSLIAKDLEGPGVLYILPDLSGESLWTKELPKSAKHEKRISVIKSLKEWGISEEAKKGDLHKSADDEISKISRSLKDALDNVFRRRPSGTHHPSVAQRQSRPNAGVNEVPLITFRETGERGTRRGCEGSDKRRG
ncbi:hypothetical protein BDW59DRAFT_177031 [Aspergillus cavernicola]|uniref:SAC3/GANP/Nin1/mts3/eIF-3 p25 family-domain-containing protein n=1 Tax=Aspergillus cavernicola TaxID=176166 RepID=A0ABR4H9Z0_9EURO